MRVTEILKEEHEIILGRIDEALNFFTKDNWEDQNFWSSFVLFLKNFADEYHHSKEESIYFVWMKEKDPMMEHGPLHCMLSEHDKSRDLVKSIGKKLEEGSWDGFRSLVEDYANLLRDHINKGNNVLYNMAENLDDGKGDETMLPKFKEIKLKE